jgi:hypothetical protein
MGSSRAFFVRCDAAACLGRPRASRAVVQIGVALVEPAQFVQLRLTLQA